MTNLRKALTDTGLNGVVVVTADYRGMQMPNERWNQKHYAYDVTIEYKGNYFTTSYYEGLGHTKGEPNLKGALYCLVTDVRCYEDDWLLLDISDGLTPREKSRLVNDLKRITEKMRRVFTAEELETLNEYYQDY